MHSLRDPLYNFVNFNQLEWDVLNRKAAQRLHFVHQLGWTYLVFPGAEHSKFGHAIGSIELTGRIFDILLEKNKSFGGLIQQGSRIAARLIPLLIHSTSCPFISREPFESRHSAALACEQLSDLFHQHNVTESYDELLAALSGSDEGRLAWGLTFGGPLNPIKMDSLLRDSLYCGVGYGRYDIDRLLDTLTLITKDSGDVILGLEESGLHTLEAFVLANYYMTKQIYNNPKVLAFDLHYEQWLKEEGASIIADNYAPFLYDDIDVLNILRRSSNQHARALCTRNSFSLAFDSGQLTSRHPQEFLQDLIRSLGEKFDSSSLLFRVTRALSIEHEVIVDMGNGTHTPANKLSPFLANLSTSEEVYIFCRKEILGQVQREISICGDPSSPELPLGAQ